MRLAVSLLSLLSAAASARADIVSPSPAPKPWYVGADVGIGFGSQKLGPSYGNLDQVLGPRLNIDAGYAWRRLHIGGTFRLSYDHTYVGNDADTVELYTFLAGPEVEVAITRWLRLSGAVLAGRVLVRDSSEGDGVERSSFTYVGGELAVLFELAHLPSGGVPYLRLGATLGRYQMYDGALSVGYRF